MEFGVLGPLVVWDGDRVVDVGGPRQRRLLAALIAHVNQVVSSDRLVEIVFEGEPTAEAATTLRSYIARLRRSLGGAGEAPIVTESPGYALRVDAETVDARRFITTGEEGRGRLSDGDAVAAVGVLRDALGLWRGPAYDEFGYEDWVRAEVLRLDEARAAAQEDLIEAQLACGMAEESVSELRRLIEQHPMRDRLRGQLMLALFRSGRQVEALRAYEAYRQVLVEVGLEPSDDLKALERSIVVHDPALQLAVPAGRSLHGYRLGDAIGEGRHGVVYRALQPGLGREVAVKAIRPELADDADFIRRFDAEAQIVAHLEHPHVVPLYDFWREPGGAYMVMRMLPGDLSRRLEEGPLDEAHTATVVRQLGSALTAAHDSGIFHGDIKPSNVLLDAEGNAYLSDFGVATLVGEATGHSDSSGFESPEQIAGEPASAAADQFALAALTAQALTGLLPFGRRGVASPSDRVASLHARRPLIPPAVDEVVWKGTSWDPQQRYPDVAAFTAALLEALGGSRSEIPPRMDVANPYRGLRPFRETDAEVFYGRDAFVDELLARLSLPGERGRFVAVVGASGGGKSSVVRAGLLPRLRAGAVPGSEEWFVATMIPGERPFDELRAALRAIAVAEPAPVADTVPGDDEVARIVRAAVPERASILLVVDQLEELFTQPIDEPVRRAFLHGLANAVLNPTAKLRVVATLRADFYDRPLGYHRFGRLIKNGTMTLVGMTAAELEQAVTRPAAGAGVEIEPKLVTEIVADVVDQPAALPILQYTLTELFDSRSGRLIGHESYGRLGGVEAAVGGRADRIYGELSEADRRLARDLFLRLVAVDDAGNATRRRAHFSELATSSDEGQDVVRVARVFGDARLLTFDRDPVTREATVEIAHEALIGHWPRLSTWVEDAGEGLRIRGHLTAAAVAWDREQRDPGDLYRGGRLETAVDWAEGNRQSLSPVERDFLDAGLALQKSEQEAERRQLDRQQRANRRLRVLLGGVAVALVVALVAGYVAVDQRNQAREHERLAAAGELAAASLANLQVDPDLSLLLALEAVRTTRPATQEAEEALHRAVLNDNLLMRVPNGGMGIAHISPDGRSFVTGGEDQTTVYVWAVAGDVPPLVLEGHSDVVFDAVYDPSGKRIASTSADGTLRVWDAATGMTEQVLDISPFPFVPVFSRDGRMVAATAPGGVWVFDAGSGELIRELTRQPGGEFTNLDFSPDGSLIAAADEAFEGAVVWNLDGSVVAEPAGHTWTIKDVGFTPDGARLLTGSWDNTIKAWSTSDWTQVDVYFAPSSVWDLEISMDGSRLAASGNNFAALWNLDTGEELQSFVPHRGIVDGVALDPASELLLTASFHDETTRLWDVRETAAHELPALPGPHALWGAVAFSPDGSLLATSRAPGSVTLWETPGGREVDTVTGLGAMVDSMAFDPTGALLATAGTSGVNIIDVETRTPTLLRPSSARDVAWSATGRLSAATSAGVVAWTDPTTSEAEIVALGPASAVVFDPTGERLAMSFEDGRIEVMSTDTGSAVATLVEHADRIWDLSFSPDGAWLAAASLENRVDVWDAMTFEHVGTHRHHIGQVFAVAMDPARPEIATGGDDDRVRIMNLDTGEVRLALPSSPVHDLTYSPDGAYLAAIGPEGPVTVYILDLDRLIAEAESRLTRGLTPAECARYLGIDDCP